MWRFYLSGFSLLLFFDTFGHLCFKYTALAAMPFVWDIDWVGRVLSSGWMYLTILSYSGAFATWMILLRKAPIGPAFAISHMQVITVMLTSVWLFNDSLSTLRILGAGLIMLGIVTLAFAERQLNRPKD
ncbi:hypothetical protein RHO15_04235 [Utexia brackfieldae]|uniref:DMT family transporter n=1 Tax=Utexia brackfieldae TaxID=3074108 RepID=UPI00370D333A